MHLRNLILGSTAKWKLFAQYFIGFKLRRFNDDLYSRSRPHQVYFRPSYYSECLHSLDKLLEICPDIQWADLTTKKLYNIFLNSSVPQLVISRCFPALNFDLIFSNVHDGFIDPYLRQLNWKMVHRILPVKYLLFARNISQDKNCILCKAQPELMDHLFLKCTCIQSLVNFVSLFIQKLFGFKILLAPSKVIFLLDLPVQFPHTFLYIISLYKSIIWIFRNRICFDAYRLQPGDLVSAFCSALIARVQVDYFRFSHDKFRRYWPETVVKVSGKNVFVNFT